VNTPDPDPRYVAPVEPVVLRCRRCGEPLPFGRINTCDDCLGRNGNAAGVVVLAFVVLVVVIVIAFVAAPRSGSEGSPPPAQSGAPLMAAVEQSHPRPAATVADAPRESGDDGSGGAAPRYRGTATHYCLPGQRGTAYCTRGYGPEDMVAAIDTDLGFDKGDVVLVRSLAGDERVTVRIVDVCGCPGSRLIDLTSGAFRRLAPLGLGVIPVTVELAGAERTLPPTDTDPLDQGGGW
jgi:hypothetical protein